MGYAIFSEIEGHLIISVKKQNSEEIKSEVDIDMDEKEKWWTMHFDGVVSREGVGAGVDIIASYCIK